MKTVLGPNRTDKSRHFALLHLLMIIDLLILKFISLCSILFGVSIQQAAWRLIRGIMPILWESYPDARLWIVGQQPGAKLKAQSDGERIVVTGRVEDVRPYLSGASVGCVPLSAGSGTKYKVLEALSAGMPLVCTPLAIEGLELEDGKHLLLGNDDKELASALMRLLEQPDLGKEITCQGNEWVQQRYSWDVILPRMDGWLDALKAMPFRRDGSEGGFA